MRQSGFAEVFGHGFKTKLSSAGLIYKHFGLSIVTSALQKLNADADYAQTGLCVCVASLSVFDDVSHTCTQST